PFWGIPPSAGGSAFGAGAGLGAGSGAALGASCSGAALGGAGCGAGFGVCAFAAPASCRELEPEFELDACPAWLPATVPANHEPLKATTPCPLVWPGFASFMNRYSGWLL